MPCMGLNPGKAHGFSERMPKNLAQLDPGSADTDPVRFMKCIVQETMKPQQHHDKVMIHA